MNEYILLYMGGDPDWMENTTEEQMGEIMQQWEVWMTNLSEQGRLVSGGDALHNGGKRIDGNKIVTDISSSEYHEMVNGYSVIKAKDFDEALTLAKSCPVFDDPSVVVEVRQALKL